VPSPQVLAVHRYFWPDAPPYAAMLRSIAGRWGRDGADVAVVTAQPSYRGGQHKRPAREAIDGFQVRRVPAVAGKGARAAVDLVAFPLTVASAILARRPAPDVVMCSTVPQVTLGVATAAAARARGASFVYHCMDLHPEIGRLSGEFANPTVYRALAALDRWTMRRATRIVVLSQDMRDSVLARDPRLAAKTVILNNFSLPDFEAPVASPLPPPDADVLRVVFTGNIGRFQGLESVVEAMAGLPSGSRVELVFMGDGKAKEALAAQAEAVPLSDGVRIVFVPQGPVSAAKALMATAHVGIVSLMPEVVRYAYPSKTATYAQAGLPMLVICEQDTELARTVREEGLGWSVSAGDTPAVVAAITDAQTRRDSAGLAPMADRVQRYAETHFAEEAVLDRWAGLLAEIVAERRAG